MEPASPHSSDAQAGWLPLPVDGARVLHSPAASTVPWPSAPSLSPVTGPAPGGTLELVTSDVAEKSLFK